MTVAPATEAVRSSAWSVRARGVACLLVVGWFALVVATLLLAPRDATLAELRSGLRTGEITEVHVYGGLPDGADHSGYAELTVRWRAGLATRQIEVREARPLDDEARDTDLVVVPAGEVDRLRELQPGLEVVHVDGPGEAGLTLEMLRRELHGWLAWWGLAVGVGTLGLLVGGPEPARATRWAWFWLFGLWTPLGFLAYLVLGGPTGLVPARPGARRLTGGWAFLSMVLLMGLVSAAG